MIDFTDSEIQKIADAMDESHVKSFSFQSGTKIERVSAQSPKWKVVPYGGYDEKVYDTLGEAFGRARQIEFAIISL